MESSSVEVFEENKELRQRNKLVSIFLSFVISVTMYWQFATFSLD